MDLQKVDSCCTIGCWLLPRLHEKYCRGMDGALVFTMIHTGGTSPADPVQLFLILIRKPAFVNKRKVRENHFTVESFINIINK